MLINLHKYITVYPVQTIIAICICLTHDSAVYSTAKNLLQGSSLSMLEVATSQIMRTIYIDSCI
jgi:hypothetical protein